MLFPLVSKSPPSCGVVSSTTFASGPVKSSVVNVVPSSKLSVKVPSPLFVADAIPFPLLPGIPWGPSLPVSPFNPCGPVGPAGPISPCGP